jgi:hypothetical protein
MDFLIPRYRLPDGGSNHGRSITTKLLAVSILEQMGRCGTSNLTFSQIANVGE